MAKMREEKEVSVNKCRTGIPSDHSSQPPFSSAGRGVPTSSTYSKPNTGALKSVLNEQAWGDSETVTRGYGRERVYKGDAKANGTQDLQKNQFTMNQHSAGYDNEVPESSWLRGGGRGGESKPGFDRGHRAPHGDEAVTGNPRSVTYKVPGGKKLREQGDIK